MKIPHITQSKGAILFEFVAIVTVLFIVGFSTFVRTNPAQRATAEPVQQQVSQESKLTVESVRPIIDATAIDSAQQQLSALESELTGDTCAQNLLTDIASIAD